MERELAEADDLRLWGMVRLSLDRDAFELLYDRYATRVYNFAFRRSGSWQMAEDVTAATFFAVWRRARRGSIPGLARHSALPYLLAVASRECANLTRADRRWHAAVRRSLHLESAPDHAETVSEQLKDEERMRTVRAALGQLPRNQREALELVVWAEMSLADAAETLGVAVGTVKSRLSRARHSLAAMPEIHRTGEYDEL